MLLGKIETKFSGRERRRFVKKASFFWLLVFMLASGFVLVACDAGNDCIRVFSDLNDVVGNQPVNAGIGYATMDL
jgi:hypothetical protein